MVIKPSFWNYLCFPVIRQSFLSDDAGRKDQLANSV